MGGVCEADIINGDDNYSICDVKQADINMPGFSTKEEIAFWAYICKTFAKLNPETEKYINDEIDTVLQGRRVIGVLCRGTDFIGNKECPIQPELQDVFALVRKQMKELQCDYIYLATEEKRIHDEFHKEFPDRVLINKRQYYDEFYEMNESSGGKATIAWVHHERENDNKLKSLEYLSSIYILSECNVLIGGIAGGSKMALYLNDNRYEYVHLFDLGMYGESE